MCILGFGCYTCTSVPYIRCGSGSGCDSSLQGKRARRAIRYSSVVVLG